MIDLHTHTTCSDGKDSPNELLVKAQKAGLEILSITDHNNALSYDMLDRSLFSGDIITGCEMATSFEGNVIEILGYGINPKVINDWYNDFYSEKNLKKNEEMLFERIKAIFDKLGIEYTKGLEMPFVEKGISKKTIYNDIVAYPKNRSILNDGLLDSYHNFFRKGLSNPKSEIFCDEASLYLSIEKVIDLIKLAGGKTFLAHLFEYNLDGHFAFLERLISKHKLDGLECYHSSFSNEQIEKMLSYARKNGYNISGGSDYHGKPSRNVQLGIGTGNLHIEKLVVQDWIKNFFE